MASAHHYNQTSQLPAASFSQPEETFADIEAVKHWLQENLALIRQSSLHPEQEIPWFNFSPFLVLLTADQEYASEVVAAICEENAIHMTTLPDNTELVSHIFTTLMKPGNTPQLLLIPDADILNAESDLSRISQLHQLMETFAQNRQGLIVCLAATKQLSHMHDSLKSVGRFDKRILLNPRQPAQRAEKFTMLIPEALRDASLYTHKTKLGKLLEHHLNDERLMQLCAVNLIRDAQQIGKKITFNDVVRQTQRGNTKSYYQPFSGTFMQQVAIHEAGHAAVTMLTTNGENIPQMVSIIESINYCALMVDDCDYMDRTSKKTNFHDSINIIRTALAGRVATELYYDLMDTHYAGDVGDLRKANDIARNLIVDYGLIPSNETPEQPYSFSLLRAQESAENTEKTNQMIERMLHIEHANVKHMLQQHRSLLEQIYELLIIKKELWQEDLLTLWQQYQTQAIK